MRLATLRTADGTTAATRVDDAWHALPYQDVGTLLGDPGWRDAAAQPGAPVEATGFAPVVPKPDKIVCCGHNYTEHIRELGHELPTHPALFSKYADALIGASDDIESDGSSGMIDWEAELAVVVGRTLRHGDDDEARAAIAGYTVANDISMRDWQRRSGQWLAGKTFDRTAPLGPALVTPDEAEPRDGLRITCTVNGELMQDARTDTLVFDSIRLVSYISQFTTLRPGDIVLTGTPGGVGVARTPARFLMPGDTVETAIDGIGSLRNTVRSIQRKREYR